MLAFYTDGLIERPRIPLTTSIAALVETVRPARSPEEVCWLAIDNLVPVQRLRDDVER
jgi:Stage II sporulation protein E (SpoIIE)